VAWAASLAIVHGRPPTVRFHIGSDGRLQARLPGPQTIDFGEPATGGRRWHESGCLPAAKRSGEHPDLKFAAQAISAPCADQQGETI